MAVKIDIKHNNTPGVVPTTSSINLNEIAFNTYDGKAYFKQDGVNTSIKEFVATPFTGSINVSGSQIMAGYSQYMPVTTNIDTTISASYIYVSGSTNDLYFSQNSAGYSNTTRLRWLEGNLYTGLLNGGIITATTGSTTFQVQSGSGIIVNLNATINANPYPTIQYLNWPTLTASIASLSASYDQQFIAINSSAQIFAQGIPYNDGDYNTKIPIGIVLHQNRSTINAVQTFPSVAYGWKQRSYDFVKAFGPLKISGYTLSASSSLGLLLSGGTAWVDGRNYTVDPNNPHYIVEATGITTSKIYYYYQSGSSFKYDTNGGAGYQNVTASLYSNSGVLTPVPTNDWTIQRVFYFPNSATKAFYIYYGNDHYASKDLAITAISTETFSEAPNTAANAILVGYMILRYNADFTTAASYEFRAAGLFRSSGGSGGSGGGGGGGATTLSGLTDVSISSPTNGQALVYNTTSTKWINSSVITASLQGTASWADNAVTAKNASTIDINVFGSPVDSYLLMSNVAGTTGVAIGGDADLRYNSSTNVLTVGNISATTLTGSLQGTASWATNAVTAPLYLPLTGGTINGNVTVNGTASIAFLNVTYESASVIYSSGSNQFGDAINDTQTLYGSVIIPTGSLTITGSLSNGLGNITTGLYSHAEGNGSTAQGAYSHAEGNGTAVYTSYGHAEGQLTVVNGGGAHAEGYATIALGDGSHTEGIGTIASGSYQHVSGKYNKRGNTTSLLVVGNGSADADTSRSDVLRVESTGLQITGSLNTTGSSTLVGSVNIGNSVVLNPILTIAGDSLSYYPAIQFSGVGGYIGQFMGYAGNGMVYDFNNHRFRNAAGAEIALFNTSNITLGTITAATYGQVQTSGSLGVGVAPGNFEVRPAAAGDTTFLKYIGTSLALGNTNSVGYSYTGGALGAIVNNVDNALLLDVGRASGGILGRVQVTNAINQNVRLIVSSSNGYGFWASTEGTGSVGIGVPVTSTPSHALDVSGSVRFRSGLTVTGSSLFTGSYIINGNPTIIPPSTPGSGVALVISGSNTKGGNGYLDFLQITNTSASLANPNKYFRLNTSGDLEILNSAYTSTLLTLTNTGSLRLGTASATSQDANSNYLAFNSNNTQIYDDGNTHIHSRGSGQSMWINTNGGQLNLLHQVPVSGGSTGSAVVIGSGTAIGFTTINQGNSYTTAAAYGYLTTGGAGTYPGGSQTLSISLYATARIWGQEIDAFSDERMKDIQGEITLEDGLKLVRGLKPIKYTWKEGVDKGLKTGYSAQQVSKAGFDHLISLIPKKGLEETIDDTGFVSPKDTQFSMNYDQVTPYHGVVIKHLLDKIEQLEHEIQLLKK